MFVSVAVLNIVWLLLLSLCDHLECWWFFRRPQNCWGRSSSTTSICDRRSGALFPLATREDRVSSIIAPWGPLHCVRNFPDANKSIFDDKRLIWDFSCLAKYFGKVDNIILVKFFHRFYLNFSKRIYFVSGVRISKFWLCIPFRVKHLSKMNLRTWEFCPFERRSTDPIEGDKRKSVCVTALMQALQVCGRWSHEYIIMLHSNCAWWFVHVFPLLNKHNVSHFRTHYFYKQIFCILARGQNWICKANLELYWLTLHSWEHDALIPRIPSLESR